MVYTPHENGREQLILSDTGRNVEVNYFGSGDNPFVFLGGSGMHPKDYSSLFAALVQEEPKLQIIAPCGPGSGNSSPLLKGEPIADWPVQLLEQTGVTAADEVSVRIVGHSRGGIEALHAAAKFEKLQVLTLSSPIENISDDSFNWLSNLILDRAISNCYAFVPAMLHFDFGALANLTSNSLTESLKFGMTSPASAHDNQAAITQLRELPIAARRDLFDNNRAQAVFGNRDTAVSRPQDRSWPGVHMTGGGHNFLIEGDIRRRARCIINLLYPKQI